MHRYQVLGMAALLLLSALWPAAAHDGEEPAVRVDDQEVRDARVTIRQVVSEGPGWLVIHVDDGGRPGAVIGYTAIRHGVNPEVVVTVDAARAQGGLFAMLHADAGTVGSYEFPGPDAPVMASGGMVNVPFRVSQAADQAAEPMLQAKQAPQVQRVDLRASKFAFSPRDLRVKAGVPVELRILSTDGTHGIAIPGLQVNERLPQGREVVVSFTPAQAGSYPFRCSVMCGPGHAQMTGRLIVE